MDLSRLIIISFILIPITTLFSSQEQHIVLTRGYGCYLNDPLRVAIQDGNCEAIAQLGSQLPFALEAQYSLLLLTDVPAVKKCVIALIKAEWESNMYLQPVSTIKTFCSHYAQLLMPWSCCRGNADRDFMIMVDGLRSTMQRFYHRSPVVMRLVDSMPHLNQPRALRSLIGMQIAKELKRREREAENIDRNAFLAALPEDLRDIITKYMTPPSSL